MEVTDDQILAWTAAGNTVRIASNGTVTISPKSNATVTAMTGAERVKRHRERAKERNATVAVSGLDVTNVTQCNGNADSSLTPPLPAPSSPPSPLSSLHPPIPAPAPSPPPSPPRTPSPKPEKPIDPRHHEITSKIGEIYLGVTGEVFSFNGHFASSLKSFLRGWTETAAVFLSRYADVLGLRDAPFSSLCKKASDPSFLCKHWMAVEAELKGLRKPGKSISRMERETKMISEDL